MKTLSERLDSYSFLTKTKHFQGENSYINEQIEKDNFLNTMLEYRQDREELKKQRIIKAKIKAFVNKQKSLKNNE